MSLILSITPKLIAQFEKATGLTFISDKSSKGNVCFADNPDLRLEFKTTFTEKDLRYYILGLSNSQNIILPKDADAFWKIVELGKSHP